MELSQNNLCVTSYNSTGLGLGVQNFLSTLSLFSNILCLQEHFLLDDKSKNYSNTDKLRNLFSDRYDMFIVPATKNNSQVTTGRGSGGLATMWDKSLTKYVAQIKCQSARLQATKFSLPCGSLLLLNTYFPCDPRVNNFEDEELLELLAEIKSTMNNQLCTYNLVLGDLNSHFSRQSRFTTIIKQFFDDLNFYIFWENTDQTVGHFIHEVDFTFQQENNGQISTSTIDHFAGNDMLHKSVIEAGVIHSGENTSNHSPIFTKLKFEGVDRSRETVRSRKRVNWDRSSEEARGNFTDLLSKSLDQLEVPDCVQCRDINCSAHTEQIENYTMAVLEAVELASQECLSSSGGGQQRRTRQGQVVPGWAEYVKPYAQESKFWSAIWCSAGKPDYGALYDAMMFSRRQFKYAVRRLKRANDKMKNDKFIQSILRGGSNIFTEIKKARGKNNNISSRIDDQVGAENIARKFANIYQKLYNQHTPGGELVQLEQEITENLGAKDLIDADRISVDVVQKALKQMKAGKNDAIFDIQSDCLTNGPPELTKHLANLLKTFTIHGSVPDFILVCTLLPLVKDNLADITSSDNYRAIASGSMLVKLLDLVILLLEGDKLTVDQLQFGFQAGSSTTMCTWTATTIIEHYNRQGSPVYACTMDLSKAFDLLEWTSLFKLLIDKGFSLLFLRVLISVYKDQSCDVRWGSSHSERFSVTNGVRQGSVSSPLLFSIYIDNLISLLRRSGLGCRIDNIFYGVLGYADDLLVLSASRSGLQAMVSICEKFAKLRRLKFSTNPNPSKSKTKCVMFTKDKTDKDSLAPIMLNGDPLPWVETVKHLGNTLEVNNSMKTDCLQKRGKFIGKIHSLLQEFHYADPSVLLKILNIYVTSFYGSNLWDLYSKEVVKIFSSWNVTVRNIFRLPRTTHRFFIEAVSDCTHPKTMMCTRFMRFVENMKTCTKLSVRYLVNLVIDDRRTLVGRTLDRIKNECQTDREHLTHAVARNMMYFPPPPAEEWRIPLVLELLDARDGRIEIPGIDAKCIEEMINDVCSN